MHGHVLLFDAKRRLDSSCVCFLLFHFSHQTSSAFRSLYGFLRVLDHLPSDIPMDNVLKNILTLTPDCVGNSRELEILSLQGKWLNHSFTARNNSQESELRHLLNTFIGKLKELQLPDNSDTQEQLFITLSHLHRLRGGLQSDNST